MPLGITETAEIPLFVERLPVLIVPSPCFLGVELFEFNLELDFEFTFGDVVIVV